MTSEEKALMIAFRENPVQEIGPLMLADHYDEVGQHEKAEFIRVCCEIEKLSYYTDSSLTYMKRWTELNERRAKLRARNPNWRPKCPRCTGRLPAIRKNCDTCDEDNRVGNFYKGLLFHIHTRWSDVCVVKGPADLIGTPTKWIKDVLTEHPSVYKIGVMGREPYWNGGGYCWYNNRGVAPPSLAIERATLPTSMFTTMVDLVMTRYQKDWKNGQIKIVKDRYVCFRDQNSGAVWSNQALAETLPMWVRKFIKE